MLYEMQYANHFTISLKYLSIYGCTVSCMITTVRVWVKISPIYHQLAWCIHLKMIICTLVQRSWVFLLTICSVCDFWARWYWGSTRILIVWIFKILELVLIMRWKSIEMSSYDISHCRWDHPQHQLSQIVGKLHSLWVYMVLYREICNI